MGKIGPKNTVPELFVRKIIDCLGFKYSLYYENLPGKPDIVFIKRKKTIFINGCFWHGHSKCNKSKLPKSNKTFWLNKININKMRDKSNYKALNKMGWHYKVIWQCKIKESCKEVLKDKIYKYLTK